MFYFFQGLNVYPEKLSIKIRQVADNAEFRLNKEKLTKAIFVIYDFFEEVDVAFEVNIPGALKISKVTSLKELLSSEQLDRVYVSSMIRSLYGLNMVWGKYFKPFDSDNPVEEFKAFLAVLVKNSQLKKIYISDSFEAGAEIQGNHLFEVTFQYIKKKQIVHHALDYLT